MKIKSAALRAPDGQIISLDPPCRHGDIIRHVIMSGGYPENYDQGFLTDTGEFVDRKRGAEIAFEAGQVKDMPIMGLQTQYLW